MNLKGIFNANKWRLLLIIILVIAAVGLLSSGQYLSVPAYNYLKKLVFGPFLFFIGLSILADFLATILKSIVEYLYSKQIQEYLHQIRSKISQNLYLTRTSNTAKVQNNLLNNLTKLTQDFAQPLLKIFDEGLYIISSIGILFSFNWILVVLTILFTIISLALPKLFETVNSNATFRVTKSNEKLLNAIQKWTNGLDELRRYASFRIFDSSMVSVTNQLKEDQIKQGRLIAVSDVINSAFNMFAQTILLIVPSILYLQNQLSFGAVMASINFSTGIMAELTVVVYNWNFIKSAKELNQNLLDLQSDASLPTKQNQVKNLKQIKVNNLHFQFKNGEKIVYPDLTFNQGEKILLTGDSGSGKSTLFKLILGQIKPSLGKISYLDAKGHELKLNFDEIGYIAQGGTLFPESIKKNITMFDSKLESQVDDNVKKVGLEKDLSKFDAGLDTQIDLDQDNLSGGQKQKIILARAFVHHEPWLLIDEGTSAIDSYATQEIISNLLKTDSTLIMIAHNFSQELIDSFDRHIDLTR